MSEEVKQDVRILEIKAKLWEISVKKKQVESVYEKLVQEEKELFNKGAEIEKELNPQEDTKDGGNKEKYVA